MPPPASSHRIHGKVPPRGQHGGLRGRSLSLLAVEASAGGIGRVGEKWQRPASRNKKAPSDCPGPRRRLEVAQGRERALLLAPQYYQERTLKRRPEDDGSAKEGPHSRWGGAMGSPKELAGSVREAEGGA